MPSKACETLLYPAVSHIFRLLVRLPGEYHNTSPTLMSRTCMNMEDSGKHRFHDLEHHSKMRLFTTYSHTSTLRGYKASRKMLQQKTSNEERKTGKRAQNTPANGRIGRRESYQFHRLARETGAQRKGKTGTMQKNRNSNKTRKRWGVEGGRVKNLASKTPSGRENIPERAMYGTQLARAE